jgi:phosphoenolpyruvate-protein phosphotransferase (PTS system enzyme I)
VKRVSLVPPEAIPVASATSPSSITIEGIAASPGIAIGPALVIGNPNASYVKRAVSEGRADEEMQRFHDAVARSKEVLIDLSERHSSEEGHEHAAILEAYVVMCGDPMLAKKVAHYITKEMRCAEWAVASSGEDIANLFGPASSTDEYIAERRHDITFVCDRILRELMGEPATLVQNLKRNTIVVAHDLSPADTASMAKEPVIALVTEVGSRTSHTAIMARALAVPAVLGASHVLHTVKNGDLVIVDGLRGNVVVNPTAIELEDAEDRARRHAIHEERLNARRDEPCRPKCGSATIMLRANLELPSEADIARDRGASGVGLYRTEFLFVDRATPPSEDEQFETFKEVIAKLAPHPVTLRTFDLGGDKFVSSFAVPPEMNPALGLRAVRLALTRPEILVTQLRAMVRASAFGPIRIMVPMVTTVQELRDVRALLEQAIAEVKARGLPCAEQIPLGMMIEVPAAAVLADIFARESAFFSLGTNDLVQYTLAIDRTNETLAAQATPFHPAILRMIRTVQAAAASARIPVSLCGAMASDPMAALLLVGLGLRDLSMESTSIGDIKETIGRFDLATVERIAHEALQCESAEAVEALLARSFATELFDVLAGEAVDLEGLFDAE